MGSERQWRLLEPASQEFQAVGTRFRIFPQAPHLADYTKPEIVWISTPPGRIRSGPADHRIEVLDPLFEKDPYDYPYLPPYVGETYPPAAPGFDGHFDEIPVESRQFLAAHAFASAARVLDIWESYLGHPITWHFAETYERLEIIPVMDWDNAQSGYGYLELGQDRGGDGRSVPYALNFDVIAHEVGHAILFSLMGVPAGTVGAGDFAPVHEGCADLISLLSFLHFDSGMDRLLRHCQGNLLVFNELNRIAELTGDRQIRLAGNARRLSDVSEDVHDRSRPLTGAVFDTLVDRFHTRLVSEGLADERLLDISIPGLDENSLQRITEFTARAFTARPFQFKSSLIGARDEIALALAQSWRGLDADDLTFFRAAEALVAAGERTAPQLAVKLDENFRWREFW